MLTGDAAEPAPAQALGHPVTSEPVELGCALMLAASLAPAVLARDDIGRGREAKQTG